MSGSMKSTFSFSESIALVCRPAEVSICDDGILLGCQTTVTFPGRLDSSSLVGAVDLCASTELMLIKFECYTFENVALTLAAVLFC